MNILSDAARAVLLRQLSQQIMAALKSRLPFFSWPVINPLILWLVTYILDLAIEKTVLGLNLAWIEMDNIKERNRYFEALDRLKKLEEHSSDDRKKQIIDEFEDSARDLIRIRVKRLQS